MAGLLTKLVDLLKGRSYEQVLLSLILAAIGVCAYWIGTDVMPEQTRQIQEGYERINRENAERNTERMKYQEDSHRKAEEANAAVTEKTLRQNETLIRALLEKTEATKERE